MSDPKTRVEITFAVLFVATSFILFCPDALVRIKLFVFLEYRLTALYAVDL